MSKFSRPTLSATNARIALSLLLAIILLGMTIGFYFIYTSLSNTAKGVAEVQTEAQSSDAKLQQLVSLKKQLEEYRPVMQKAEQIVADSQSYQYQNQIINDLTEYANQAGISITSFTFQETTDGGTTTSSSSNSASSAPTDTQKASSGLKSIPVSIQLGEGVKYENLLHFVYLIEQNLTRMQLSEISFSGGDGSSAGAQTLNLEVYIR